MPLLTFEMFKDRTLAPVEDVDELEARRPGFIEKRIGMTESWIHARLAKRYDVPFSEESPPEIVLGWTVAIVTLSMYGGRGFNPSSAQDQASIVDPATRAEAEIMEAANSETGLFELPLRQDKPSSSAVAKGGPFGYSEQSPYTWMDRQMEAANGEG